MAPRKTKTTTEVEQTLPSAVQDEHLAATEAADARKVENTVTLNVAGIAKEVFDLEVRFQVALAILPTVIRHGADQHLEGRLRDSDENEAGACARIAFEYADAFIAQSKKGQGDGE